jgi:serine/threonine protein kinase/WD40 repeat protein
LLNCAGNPDWQLRDFATLFALQVRTKSVPAEAAMSERELFIAALRITDPAERTLWLDRECGGDAALRQRIDVLLRAFDKAGSLLENPAVAASRTTEEPPSEAPGTVMGAYKLLEQIGEGGMGLVFMAEQQQPVRRKVALKVLKPGMDTRQVVARFEAERQALALMDHPNIAHVFDGGETPTGRPYFVMELVRGVPITQFCDCNHLTIRARLELFVSVCQAVQHAHQKGIIHRDLKPSNVLVTLHDNVPVVKVIDFGIAKATGQQLTDKTLFTQFAQMMGTPMYMSPEQAQMSGLDVDTRTDIYAVGVLLYELLSGTTPFPEQRLRTAALEELRRIIREEEPARPSARLSTLGQAAATVSANRQTDPQRLSQLVKGELDWIVMKCLEKDRNRRYETAGALAQDVERYLSDEPVQACPPSAAYRIKKSLRRYKGRVLAAGLLLMALVGGIIGTTWGMLRANEAEADALGQASQKEQALIAARRSERDANAQLFQALVHQARALRHTGSVGARSESLKALDKAAALAPTLGLGKDQLLALRKEAIACLTQTNLTFEREWEALLSESRGLAFDPSLRLYARGERSDISVRRIDDNQEVARLDGVLSLLGDPEFKFSPDGDWLMVRDWTNPNLQRVTVWDLKRRRPLVIPDVVDFDFHPAGRHAAAALADGSIRLYDLRRGEQQDSFVPKLTGPSLCVRYDARGAKLAVARAGSQEIEVWDTDRLSLEERVNLPGPFLHSMAWHPGGRLLAVVTSSRIMLHDLDASRTTFLEGHQAAVRHVAFNEGGDLLASVSWDNTAQLWDARSGRQLLQMLASSSPGPQFSRDDQRLAVRYGRTAKVFKLDRSTEYRAFPSLIGASSGFGNRLQFSADNRLLGVAGEKGLRFWDLATAATVGLLALPHSRSLLYDPDGKHLITTSARGVHLWPVTRSREGGAVRWHIGPPEALAASEVTDAHTAALSADGRTLVVSSGRGWAAVLDLPARKLTARLTGHDNLTFVAISPDGRWVTTAAWSGLEIVVWDALSSKPVTRWPHSRGHSANVTFSPDGKWLATAAVSDYRLIETDNWQIRRIIPKKSGGDFLGTAAFSGDGKVLALADTPHEVKLLDPETGDEYATLPLPGGLSMTLLCFSPDGSRLAAHTEDHRVHVWDLRRTRQRLAAMKLDWDLPPPPPPAGDAEKPVRVDVDLGELEPVRVSRAQYRRALEANPDDASACNNLAWIYATGPPDLRNPKEALRLANNAVRLAPNKYDYLNTLGVVYYRLDRWSEAAATLEDAIKANGDKATAFDLFFLAMCHQRLGEPEKAGDCYRRANEWWYAQTNLPQEWAAELESFRTEAATLLGLGKRAPR